MSHTARLQRVPQELTDWIIDILSYSPESKEDWRALSNCSRVCRSWSPRASRHLLKHIDVLAPKFVDFLDFVCTSERYRTHTTELSVLGTVAIPRHWDMLLTALPKLSSLEIWSNSFRADDLPVPDPTTFRRHNLSKLSLHFVNWDQLPLFLYPFGHVDILSLRSVFSPLRVEDDDSVEHAIQSLPINVGQLNIEDRSVHAGTLRHLQLLLHSPTLVVNKLNAMNIAALTYFLGLTQARNDITRLELIPTTGTITDTIVQMLLQDRLDGLSVLARCDKLATIALSVADVAWAMDLVRVVLLHMPATIQHLRITLARDQWQSTLELLEKHFGAHKDKYRRLVQLELRGLCAGASSESEEQQQLADIRSEVEGRLSPRVSAITTVLP
ncbi:hypothetical protein PsYK624_115210 [Phanerochaete sordida]|uniref:F-box domain-containing protein n=1 Tax=Phanerochaete sordida TaxID=48140 RepID=A0A9P3LIM9_9APHY|nr:hypothetical protein PsYK624_115210 [Phanerochaete sordida]